MLAHPLCLVTEIQLRPFRAWFQNVRRGVRRACLEEEHILPAEICVWILLLRPPRTA